MYVCVYICMCINMCVCMYCVHVCVCMYILNQTRHTFYFHCLRSSRAIDWKLCWNDEYQEAAIFAQ